MITPRRPVARPHPADGSLPRQAVVQRHVYIYQLSGKRKLARYVRCPVHVRIVAMGRTRTRRQGIQVSSETTDVLVIDDDGDLRELLHVMLASDGYTVYEAPDGVSGLDRLRTHPTALVVLLDWQMPGMDGIQVLHMLATDAPVARRHAFILLTSLYDAPELHRAALPPDIPVTVMCKPFDMDALLHAVAQAAEHIER